MRTDEIRDILSSDAYAKKYFTDVYAIDQLPKVLIKKKMYVINLDTSREAGSHWCYISTFNSPQFTLYFDSFGRKPPERIIPSLLSSSASIYYSDRKLQSEISGVCGEFVILVGLLQSRGWNILDIITHFPEKSKTFLFNDAYAYQVISRLTPDQTPQTPFFHPDISSFFSSK